MNGKAELILRLADDLDIDKHRILRPDHPNIPSLRTTSTKGKDLRDEDRSASILNVGRPRIEDESSTINVPHCLPFATLDLFACIIAAQTTAFGGPDTLAIQVCGAR